MEKVVVNPEAELPERPGDTVLSAEQLAALAVFASMKKTPSFDKLPGTHVLRRYRKGEAICTQGEPGKSAFYMLTAADLRAIFAPAPATIDAKQAVGLGPAEQTAAAPSKGAEPRPQQVAGPLNRSSTDERPQRLATARLVIDAPVVRQASGAAGSRWFGLRGKRPAPRELQAPLSIPNDGPTDIDYATREAPVFAGDVFGEMSCQTRQPRSATVVADEDSFALEFLRNVLDKMLQDPQYKARADAKYRERVMQLHLRNLSLFRLLSDEQFRRVVSRIELVEASPGTVLWDEGDQPDAAFVVRSGFVKVIKDYPWRLQPNDVGDWKKLTASLAAPEGPLSPLGKFLSAELTAVLAEASEAPSEALKNRLLAELNELAKTKQLLLAKELAEARADARFTRETDSFGPKPKDWQDLETRRANRVLFHVLAPTLIKPPAPLGVACVKRYVGRGGTLGELAVCGGIPRQATCVAYSHPRAGFEATNVELVRVPGELLKELLEESPEVRQELDRTIQGIRAENERAESSIQSVFHSRRVEELGLMQGQNLMLIDLERCTRCGDCVEACIDAHDDGFSRLYLDGPRFGKYLTPSSCRMCRDPVCMIGCPVGSIQQGDAGQIVIRDWCIGCRLCADQCPYDSIQMHDLSVLRSGEPGWRWMQASKPPDAGWFTRKYSDRDWAHGTTPFLAKWGTSAASHASGAAGDGLGSSNFYFRFQFNIDSHTSGASQACQLNVTAEGGGATVYLDGQQIQLLDPDAEKKRKQEEIRRKQEEKAAKEGLAKPLVDRKDEQTKFVATIPGHLLKAGSHLLAAVVKAPARLEDAVFDLSLQRLPPEQERVKEVAVTRRAVVCDQCSSLSGHRQACVYACPHEAAIRIDGASQLPHA